jgi:Icc protein
MSVVSFKNLGWTTDIHLDIARLKDEFGIRTFGQKLSVQNIDGLLVTGDIAEADTLIPLLEEFHDFFQKPIYFVLGNHDHYGSSVSGVKDLMEHVTSQPKWRKELVYLGLSDYVELTPNVALVGENGWYDARHGDINNTVVGLRDFTEVYDLRAILARAFHPLPALLGPTLARLGHDSAKRAKVKIEKAFEQYDHVMFGTHIPPFSNSARYHGMDSQDWLPFTASKWMGDTLLEIMTARPNKTLHVFCGHVHCANNYDPLPNLRVRTGGAIYGSPAMNAIIDLTAIDKGKPAP